MFEIESQHAASYFKSIFPLGHPVVLAQLKRHSSNKIPSEYCLCRHKLRPGSGALAVRVLTDGPTRVVRITDASDEMVRSHTLSSYFFLELFSCYHS